MSILNHDKPDDHAKWWISQLTSVWTLLEGKAFNYEEQLKTIEL